MIMSTKYLLRNFIKFLKSNEVYENYILHLKETKGGQKESINFIVRYITYTPKDMIMDAFMWNSSKNQEKTWAELHFEWQRLLKTYYDK